MVHRPPPDERSLDALMNILDAYIHTHIPSEFAGYPIPLLHADAFGTAVRLGPRVVSTNPTLWHMVRTRAYLAHRERSTEA